MRRGVFIVRALLIVIVISSFAPRVVADIFLSSKIEPAPHLATHWLITLTATTSDPTESILYFNFRHRDGEDPSTDFGIFCEMNQVSPAGFPTVFQDLNATFPLIGAFPDQDSQFLFHSTEATVFALSVAEDTTSLHAEFLFSEGLGQSVPFAQIVMRGGSINFRGVISALSSSGLKQYPIDGGIYHISIRVPEPTSAVLASLGAVLGCIVTRSRNRVRHAIVVAVRI